MSNDARFMCGLSLILVPTIIYGGLTVLGIVTKGAFGAPGPRNLDGGQISLYRAGHAHAGVLMLLTLFIQIATDYAAIPHSFVWPVRAGSLAAALLVSGGFFAIAHLPSLRILLYTGATLLAAVTLTLGIGLMRTI